MTDLETELKQATLNELEDHLVELGEVLNNANYDEFETEHFNQIFRIVHSIKGNTRASGFDTIANVSHKYESKLIHVKSGSEPYTKAMHEMSLSYLDQLCEANEYLKKDIDAYIEFQELERMIDAVGSEVEKNISPSAQESESVSTNSISCLIIDDDSDVIEIIKTYISNSFDSNFQLELNGQDALDRALTHKFDIIICDYKMPVLDGKKFIEGVRKSNSNNVNTPIIFLSGYRPKLEADEQMWNNVFFIEKPFAEHKLIYYVKCSLELSKNLEAA